MVGISIRTTETGLLTAGDSFQPVLPSYFLAVRENTITWLEYLGLELNLGPVGTVGHLCWLCLSPGVAADGGVLWLFQTMLPFRALKAHRDTTELTPSHKDWTSLELG